MLDIKFIRENADLIRMGAEKKKIKVDLDALLEIDEERKVIQNAVDEMRTRQNEVSQKIPHASEDEKSRLLEQMKSLKNHLQEKEDKLKAVMQEWQRLMLTVPNIPDASVPDGNDDASNQEIKVWGEKPNFNFTPQDHIKLMEKHDMADFERGIKVSGFRGYFLKNDGARLEWAILSLAFDHMIKKGFSPMIVPSLVRKENLYGTGYLPQGEEDLYKTQDDDYLVGTAEVSVMGYYSGEVLEKTNLPVKVVAFSPAFRREAGSHGKDTKGLIRVHEFYKMEQVILCEANHAESVKFHEELLLNSEEIMQTLEIPYHVVVNCGGDLGLGQVKKYDIEAWVPSEGTYRETHSASYFHDFQTRRLNIKYKEGDKKLYAHSLNDTAIAGPRILVPFVENHQQADGSIKIPKALVPYMGKEVIK